MDEPLLWAWDQVGNDEEILIYFAGFCAATNSDKLSEVGHVVRALDHALHRADAMVSPFIDDLRRQEVHPAFDHACRAYEETVEAVTQTRQQLFDLPMIVTPMCQI
jgi:hypothetical protein